MTEPDLRSRLRDLAERDAPPPRIDVDLALRRGRRSRRLRRACAVVAPALAVAVAAVTLLPGADPGPPPPSVAPAPVPLPNPITEQLEYGWLPDGYTPHSRSLQEGRVYFRVTKADSAAQVVVTLFPKGPEPELGYMRRAVPAVAIPVPDVGGRAAHWLQPPPPGAGTADGEARLRVEFAPGRWGEVEVNETGLSARELTRIVRKVAAGVRIVAEPARFPFQISGFPARLTLDSADSSPETANVHFTEGLGIALYPSDVRDHPWRNEPNTTVDGHPAHHLVGTSTTVPADDLTPEERRLPENIAIGSERLCVYDVNGMDVCLTTSGHPSPGVTPPPGKVSLPTPDWASEILRPSGGLLGLYRRMTVLGPHEDAWTAAPFLS
ncbi:hypothetical protein [Actinocorallia sp. A-T 12471]|uniref:hypothetical protein n=1 Tax=Actinocorallia sp. A-T 12471 TaxID=3089813 RepID=UPI0029CC946A|nr:hypothetical protein [Actinocorallia sp. A-T 12471]MDX6742285.1 hypothetical protein [Actinocorallia sp. A-T 12471]